MCILGIKVKIKCYLSVFVDLIKFFNIWENKYILSGIINVVFWFKIDVGLFCIRNFNRWNLCVSVLISY